MRVALLNNQIPPYRVPVYNHLSELCDLSIILSGYESNRSGWRDYAEKNLSGSIVVEFASGWIVPYRRSSVQAVFDEHYLHIHPGYFTALLKYRPDVVISTEMGPRSVCAYVYSMLFGRPLYIWWGGTMHTERERGTLRLSVRRLLVGSKLVRFISYGESSTEYLSSIGVNEDRICQIQNCVDDVLFRKQQSGARVIEGGTRRLLYVGQLVGRKGVEELLHGYERARKRSLPLSLTIVGEGAELSRYRRLVEANGIEDVAFVGSVGADEMPGLYHSHDVLVFPTLEDVWGLVVNEALLSGLPVLCSQYAGCAGELFDTQHVFDPLSPFDVDRVLDDSVGLPRHPNNVSPLWTCREVSAAIWGDILDHAYSSRVAT
jgi:glycosyltransferase involved in cell wall biosynthesis